MQLSFPSGQMQLILLLRASPLTIPATSWLPDGASYSSAGLGLASPPPLKHGPLAVSLAGASLINHARHAVRREPKPWHASLRYRTSRPARGRRRTMCAITAAEPAVQGNRAGASGGVAGALPRPRLWACWPPEWQAIRDPLPIGFKMAPYQSGWLQ